MKNIFSFILVVYLFSSFVLKGQSEYKSLQTKPSINAHSPLHNYSHSAIADSLTPLYDSIYKWNMDYGIYISKTIGFIYDKNNNLLSETYQLWNDSAWENRYRYAYTYNSNNSVVSYLEQVYVASGWENYYRVLNFNNASDLDTNTVSQTWNGSNWVNQFQYMYTYNSNNLASSFLYQSWSGGVWANEGLDYYTYNANGLKASDLSEDWNWNFSAWVRDDSIIYNYNSNNLETSNVTKGWSGSAWILDADSTAYEYNANNLLVNYISYEWNSNTWQNSEYYYYTYDTNNNVAVEEYYTWGGTNWNLYSGNTYTHNSNNNTLSDIYVLEPSWMDSAYFYFHYAKKQDMAIMGTGLIFPNPNNGLFTIQNAVDMGASLVEIYNILGPKIYQNKIADFNSPVSIVLNVETGVYFMVITGNHGVMKDKIVIQR